jgi:hypothetical protein
MLFTRWDIAQILVGLFAGIFLTVLVYYLVAPQCLGIRQAADAPTIVTTDEPHHYGQQNDEDIAQESTTQMQPRTTLSGAENIV